MSKKKVIFISIFMCLIATFCLLFGVFFRVKMIDVVQINDSQLSVSAENILNVANLDNKATFFINKDEIIKNIEQKYPRIKVVQIKTLSPTSLEIRARNREDTYYIQSNEAYYILDEELKVLEKSKIMPTDVIKLQLADEIEFSLDYYLENAEVQAILHNFYLACYKTKIDLGSGLKNIDRADIINLIEFVNIKKSYTLTGNFYCIEAKTSSGVKFEIQKASEDLDRKVNLCFASYSNSAIDKTQGTIKLFYDAYDVEHLGYQK